MLRGRVRRRCVFLAGTDHDFSAYLGTCQQFRPVLGMTTDDRPPDQTRRRSSPVRPQAPQKARGAAYLGLPRGVAMASEMTPKPLEHQHEGSKRHSLTTVQSTAAKPLAQPLHRRFAKGGTLAADVRCAAWASIVSRGLISTSTKGYYCSPELCRHRRESLVDEGRPATHGDATAVCPQASRGRLCLSAWPGPAGPPEPSEAPAGTGRRLQC
ncbi:hypothetical protein F5X68DRAFT_208920 [Plectosphaerella plurivora]|uniref:Uncharacterized protein n=1 Tax=Plectosphaerella plurivora TaxID=936078 RepID=A0A9P8VAX7_9PEZI|nr:hypothetical protein F5X68DRAFT_208920 [Plectosphaerella plurivora]